MSELYGRSVGRLVNGHFKSLLTTTNIGEVGGIPQCQIRLSQYFDPGGKVPVSIINKSMPTYLRTVAGIQHAFQRDKEFDRYTMSHLANVMKSVTQAVTEEEVRANIKTSQFISMVQKSKNFDAVKTRDR